MDVNKKNVSVALKTIVNQENESETFEFIEEGELVIKNDSMFLRYTEHISDQTPTKVLFKLENSIVRLNRTGDSMTKLVFENGKSIPAYYQTPAGQMQLYTETTALDTRLDFENTSGRVQVAYQLIANGTIVGDYEFELHFSDKFSKIN